MIPSDIRYGVVYIATSRTTGKSYIGQTIQKLATRKKRHKYDSKRLDCHFYRAIHKYGWGDFDWEILAIVEKPADYIKRHLDYWEKRFIYMYDTFNTGYNGNAGGQGAIHTSESKAKMSKSLTGRKHSDKTKQLIRQSLLGKNRFVRTDEMRKKISQTSKGRKAWNYGKELSQEHKNKISLGNIGKHVSPDWIDKNKLSTLAKNRKRNKLGRLLGE